MENNTTKLIAKNVDEYIENTPEQFRKVLEEMRKAIKTAAPEAEEVISYQIPTYKYFGSLVHFAAFNNHCSFFGINKKMFKQFQNELKGFEIKGTTIHFTEKIPLPNALIQEMVKIRLKENEKLFAEKKSAKSKAVKKVKPSDLEKVEVYMKDLKHPLKDEIESVRELIKSSNKNISERIKWNAPSYFYKEDIVTFNLRATKHVHLVFHHPLIVEINSTILEGNYKDRRMVYFDNMNAVKKNSNELQRILNELIKMIEKKSSE